MVIVFDLQKTARNEAERGLNFDLVRRMDWATARIREDPRRDYGEIRLLATVLLDNELFVVVITPRDGDLRVISLRKANRKEGRLYDEAQRAGR